MLECAYFAVVTLTTVGYGDVVPRSATGRMLGMVLALGGVVVVATFLNALLDKVVFERRKANLDALDDARRRRVSSTGADRGGLPALRSHWAAACFAESLHASGSLLHALQPLLFALAAGGLLAHVVEGWKLLDSFYFCLISILTVGYGDLSPSTYLGRLLTTILLPLGVACAGNACATLSDKLRDRLTRARPNIPQADNGEGGEQLDVLERLLRNASDEAGVISEAEFICTSLLEMELVDARLLAKARRRPPRRFGTELI